MLQDIKKTSKHSIVYALGNFATKIIGLILIPLYTNPLYLTHDEFGVLAVLEASLQLLVGLLAFAMVGSLTRWYWDTKYKEDQKSIFFTTLVFLILVLIPSVFVLSLFTNNFSILLFDTVKYAFLLKLTFGTAALQIINNQILCLLKLQSKSKRYSFLQIFKLSLILILILYWILVKGEGLIAIWKANIIGELVFLIIQIPYVLRNIKLEFQRQVLKEMLSYGLPLMLASVSGVLLAVTDRYMLSSMSGLEETGIYSVGFRIANALKIVISTSLLFALSPLRMKKMNEPDNQRFYSKILTYSAFVFIIGTLGVSLFALEVIKIFTSSVVYWESNNIVPVISFALFFGLLKDNITIGLSIQKATKTVGLYIFLTGILNVGLNLFLIPYFDIYGAAMATLLSQVFLFLMLYNNAQKVYPIPYEIRKLFILILLSSAFIILGNSIANWETVFRVAFKSLLFISFPFVLYLVRFYEDVEVTTIKNIFKQWNNPTQIKENINRLFKAKNDN